MTMMARITRATRGPNIIMKKEAVKEEMKIYGCSSRTSLTMRIVLRMARAIMQEPATTTLIRRKGEAIDSKEGPAEVIGIQEADEEDAETMNQAQHEKVFMAKTLGKRCNMMSMDVNS
eukprot:11641712-Ditylum_brightwellii.AAC.1